jgi:hypothetical protein
MNIPELPIQVVAVTDSAATSFHQTQELNQVLVVEVSIFIHFTPFHSLLHFLLSL